MRTISNSSGTLFRIRDPGADSGNWERLRHFVILFEKKEGTNPLVRLLDNIRYDIGRAPGTLLKLGFV